MSSLKLLENKEIIKWCYSGITEITLKDTSSCKKLKQYNLQEKKWGHDILIKYLNYPLDKYTCQWTNRFGEELVKEALIKLGKKNVTSAKTIKNEHGKNYQLDIQCDDYLYEVKTRNWTTCGTAGEKILGIPLKYSGVTENGKTVKIILIGYAEYEAKHDFAFGNLFQIETCNKNAQNILKTFKNTGFEFIPFTDILLQLGFNEDAAIINSE